MSTVTRLARALLRVIPWLCILTNKPVLDWDRHQRAQTTVPGMVNSLVLLDPTALEERVHCTS